MCATHRGKGGSYDMMVRFGGWVRRLSHTQRTWKSLSGAHVHGLVTSRGSQGPGQTCSQAWSLGENQG